MATLSNVALEGDLRNALEEAAGAFYPKMIKCGNTLRNRYAVTFA